MRISAGVQTCALPIFGPGEIFGSVAIFTDHLYPADGIAMVGSTEASWTRADWLGLIERYPRIALNLIAIVGRRLAELQGSEEHTSELQSLMRNSYAVFCLKTKTIDIHNHHNQDVSHTYP